jgi:hypothetical protein
MRRREHVEKVRGAAMVDDDDALTIGAEPRHDAFVNRRRHFRARSRPNDVLGPEHRNARTPKRQLAGVRVERKQVDQIAVAVAGGADDGRPMPGLVAKIAGEFETIARKKNNRLGAKRVKRIGGAPSEAKHVQGAQFVAHRVTARNWLTAVQLDFAFVEVDAESFGVWDGAVYVTRKRVKAGIAAARLAKSP